MEDRNLISLDDINKFFAAFTDSTDISFCKSGGEQIKIDKMKFLRKLGNFIENAKGVKDKKQLKQKVELKMLIEEGKNDVENQANDEGDVFLQGKQGPTPKGFANNLALDNNQNRSNNPFHEDNLERSGPVSGYRKEGNLEEYDEFSKHNLDANTGGSNANAKGNINNVNISKINPNNINLLSGSANNNAGASFNQVNAK